MTARAIALAGAFTLGLAGVATAGALTIDTDAITVVRVPGPVIPKSCVVTATADAHVDEAQPDTNLGSAPTLGVAGAPAVQRTYVRFDLSSCAIPSGADVRSAALRLVLAGAPAQDRTWKARRVASSWSEAGITWNALPGLAAVSTDAASTGTVDGAAVEWNVGADVAGGEAAYGWRIVDEDESTPFAGSLASRENATSDARPRLTVTWFD